MPDVDPILRVTVGTPVFTWDNHRLGKIKEIQNEAFKVETGLLQRDYWLPAESINEAVPDEAVILTLEKDQVDGHKVADPPAQERPAA